MVSSSLQTAFSAAPSTDTEQCLDYLAEGLLDEMSTTRSRRMKKEMVKEFLTLSICSGLLIATRRYNIDTILYTNNTETEH